MYKRFLRPLLFLFPPETVHALIVFALCVFCTASHLLHSVTGIFCLTARTLEKRILGLRFPNPVGLAAGFDKNASFYKAFRMFGFGFIEIGTVTPKPQPGNPRPRSFRLPLDKALINRMGFNNDGARVQREKLKRGRPVLSSVGNIGKNTATPNEKLCR